MTTFLFEIEMLLACAYEDPQFEEFLSCVNFGEVDWFRSQQATYTVAQYLAEVEELLFISRYPCIFVFLLLKDYNLFEIEMLLACEYEDPQSEEFLSCVNTVSLIGLYYSKLEFLLLSI